MEFPILDSTVYVNVDDPGDDGGDDDDDNGNGNSMIDGMGIVSRIIQKEYDGRLTYGTGIIGNDVSLVPYLIIDDSTTDFVALIDDMDTELLYHIPALGVSYELRGDNLVDVTSPNLLNYINSNTVFGSNVISNSNDHITVTGNGVSIIEIDDSFNDETLFLDGVVQSGFLKIVTSNYDLIEQAEFLYEFSDLPHTDNGYEVGELNCGDVIDDNYTDGTYTWQYHSGNWIWTLTASWYNNDYTVSCIPVSPIVISSVDNVYGKADVEVYYTSLYTWCDDFHPDDGGGCRSVNTPSTRDTYTISSTLNDLPLILSMELITSISGSDDTLDEIKYVGYYIWENYCSSCENYIPFIYEYEILELVYDIGIDYYTSEEFTKDFNDNILFPNEKSYLIISPDGGVTSIRGTVLIDVENSLKITNLPFNTAYQITKSDDIIAIGITSSTGVIDLIEMKLDGGYWKHICAVCDHIWYSKNQNPKVCGNVKCTNRTHWKRGNKRK